ncbi:hypothetical protein ACIHFE_29870 [Streptomyces sp. NPDC052396]|uniref:hypothetical protein n=1 Tax=Streptomyces sp. NPDC052396 TaxID=3365689 RepID=UPI0037D24EF7
MQTAISLLTITNALGLVLDDQSDMAVRDRMLLRQDQLVDELKAALELIGDGDQMPAWVWPRRGASRRDKPE